MFANWKAEELMATASPSTANGTILGRNDCEAGIMNARAVPSSAITANIGKILPLPRRANSRSSSAQSKTTARQERMMRRRS